MALLRVFLVAVIGLTCVRAAAQTVVASLPELAAAAVRDGQRVVMKPGLYRMADVLSRAVIQEDCRAEGNERGFWVADDAVLTRCVGDATLGPLLFVEGARVRADLTLTQGQPLGTVHALASIAGDDHQIHIRPGPGAPAAHPAPILVGYGVPMMGEGMAPIPEARSRRLNLVNETIHPIEVSARAEDARLRSKGAVTKDRGRRTGIERGS